MMSGKPKRRSSLAALTIVAVVLLLTGMWTANAWFKHQRMIRVAGVVPAPDWHRKMIDLCCQMEGLDVTQVIERFKAQQFSASIGYEDVRIDVCGQTRNCVKHVIVSAGQSAGIGPRVWIVQVWIDDAGRAFAARVWTTASLAQMDSIIEFCEPGRPSVRDRKGR